MADRPLPAPVTPGDELLVVLITEVVGLRADLAAARMGGERPPAAESTPDRAEAEDVEVREPAPPKRRPRR